MIFTEPRDPRFITLRRGGSLTDANHRLLAVWAATCAAHVIPIFESVAPGDVRLHQALAQNRAWVAGDITMRQALKVSSARAAAHDVSGAARFAAYAVAQAVAVAHVAAHELGAAAYAIRAVQTARGDEAGRAECRWQREQLPTEIRDLVLDDQRLRNHACWFVFDC